MDKFAEEISHKDYKFKYALRAYIPTLFLSVVSVGIAIYLYWNTHFSFSPPMPLNFVISPLIFSRLFLFFAAAGCFKIGYSFIHCLTGYIFINKRAIEINEGVFSRIKDSTDLTLIEDRDIKRNLFDMILGISKLEIKLVNKPGENITIARLTKKDTQKLYEYLLANSFASAREYWAARDRAELFQGNKIVLKD